MKNKIKIERVTAGMTQAQLAGKVQVSRQTINAVEGGKYAPSTVISLKMAKVFGKSVNDIFALQESDWVD